MSKNTKGTKPQNNQINTKKITRKKINSSGNGNMNQISNSFHHHQSFMTGNDSSLPTQTNYNTSLNLNNNPMEEKILENKKNVATIIDCSGNKPSPRFGHSIIMINKVKTCLFGGAVGDTKNFQYVNDTYIFNLMTRIWTKITPSSNSPIPKERAAHAAAANESMQMVIHGGSIGNSLLAEDELWLFDMKRNQEKEGRWSLINTIGKGPGKRYGHTLAYLKPFFILFGGNLNQSLSNDAWIIDITAEQITWKRLDFPNNMGPSPRLYHTCGFFGKGTAQGMMIVFGGRDASDNPLDDIWGLRHHRDGRWDWILAPLAKGGKIRPRYNHSVAFIGALMIILGGRTKNFHGTLPIEVYDSERSDSYEFPGIGIHRHSSFIFDRYIYLYGGFPDKNQFQPMGTLSKISLENLFDKSTLSGKILEIGSKNNQIVKLNSQSSMSSKSNQKSKFKLSHDVVVGEGNPGEEEDMNDESPMIFRKVAIEKLQEENKRIGEDLNNKGINSLLESRRQFNFNLINNFIDTLLRPFDWFDEKQMDDIHQTLPFTDDNIINLLKEVKPLIERDHSLVRIRSPCKIFGNLYGEYNDLMRFFESFGNPSDDNQSGDIAVMQYVFLGDFCDRGYYSLEVILLLFALKVKYPDHIYLIRGHHEDININESYGLGQECKERVRDNLLNQEGIFRKINKIFDCLPLGVLVDDAILCLHGGIGSSINILDDIDNIKRPLNIIQEVSNSEQQKVIDIIWSEYNDEIEDIEMNSQRDKNNYGFIVSYGKSRLNKFLDNNKLALLITAHQFVKDGIMTFNEDRLLTVFSATNYMDKYKNLGGMIIIAKKTPKNPFNIMPKMINIYESKRENYRKNRSPSPIRDK